METSEDGKQYLKVPMALLSVFLFMIVQTFGAVWWASAMSTEQKNIKDKIVEMNLMIADRYTSKDAARDFGIVYDKMIDLRSDLEKLKDFTYKGLNYSGSSLKYPVNLNK